ncbi:MAG: divalent-cation tolerance protein CutA [Vicinamibacterales bacterium]
MTADTASRLSDPGAAPVVIVLTTLPADADAAAFGAVLVNERLAACASIGAEMTSVYTWKGAVERARERQLVIKTTEDRVPLIEARLATLHPYDVPELLVLRVAGGGETYLAWVRESTAL